MERTGYPENVKGKVPYKTRFRHGMDRIAGKILGWMLRYKKYQLGSFMMSGQTHKWMYDEYGLSQLMKEAGFSDIRRRNADDSGILKWSSYGLEMFHEKKHI